MTGFLHGFGVSANLDDNRQDDAHRDTRPVDNPEREEKEAHAAILGELNL